MQLGVENSCHSISGPEMEQAWQYSYLGNTSRLELS